MIDNILESYDAAGQDLALEGLWWYREANSFARELGQKSKIPWQWVANAISHLSPSVSWEINKRDAERLAMSDNPWEETVSTYGAQQAKAIAALDGEPFQYTGYNAKTYNFAMCIKYPRHRWSVTVDRHAWACASREPEKKVTPKRYRDAAAAYRDAAAKVGILPLEMQAITWLETINRKQSNAN